MNKSKINVKVSGGGTFLTTILVVLKALGYIDWSWWLVFGPMWIPLTLFFSVMLGVPALISLGVFLFFVGEEALKALKRKWSKK